MLLLQPTCVAFNVQEHVQQLTVQDALNWEPPLYVVVNLVPCAPLSCRQVCFYCVMAEHRECCLQCMFPDLYTAVPLFCLWEFSNKMDQTHACMMWFAKLKRLCLLPLKYLRDDPSFSRCRNLVFLKSFFFLTIRSLIQRKSVLLTGGQVLVFYVQELSKLILIIKKWN